MQNNPFFPFLRYLQQHFKNSTTPLLDGPQMEEPILKVQPGSYPSVTPLSLRCKVTATHRHDKVERAAEPQLCLIMSGQAGKRVESALQWEV